MRNRRSAQGFTLVELIIALSLSSFILAGIVGVASQMVRFQMEGKKKGDVTGWTIVSLIKMNKELENASVLDCPSSYAGCSGLTSDYISGCSNYTRMTSPAGPIDTSPGNNTITAFYYCVPTSGANANQLLRYGATGTCPMAAPTCGSTAGFEVYAQDFYKVAGLTYFFRRANEVNGIELNYIVGIATANADSTGQRTMPVYMKMQTKIGMNKTYNNTVD